MHRKILALLVSVVLLTTPVNAQEHKMFLQAFNDWDGCTQQQIVDYLTVMQEHATPHLEKMGAMDIGAIDEAAFLEHYRESRLMFLVLMYYPIPPCREVMILWTLAVMMSAESVQALTVGQLPWADAMEQMTTVLEVLTAESEAQGELMYSALASMLGG